MKALLKLARNRKNISAGRIFLLTFSEPQLKTLVVRLNREQLRASQLTDDTLIPFVYSEASEEFGKTPGKRWTLHDTGELYDSIKVVSVTEEYIIQIGDLVKDDRDFNELFNGNILGLNTESRILLIKEALPEMRRILRSELLRGI